jgi:3-(methylthio)propanoyl-CoA dehydrogenase
MPYAAPLDEMRFVIDTVASLDGSVERDVADAILDEAAKFAAAELDPLNQPADRIGSILENGVVRTPPGFREAYLSRQARSPANGWAR